MNDYETQASGASAGSHDRRKLQTNDAHPQQVEALYKVLSEQRVSTMLGGSVAYTELRATSYVSPETNDDGVKGYRVGLHMAIDVTRCALSLVDFIRESRNGELTSPSDVQAQQFAVLGQLQRLGLGHFE